MVPVPIENLPPAIFEVPAYIIMRGRKKFALAIAVCSSVASTCGALALPPPFVRTSSGAAIAKHSPRPARGKTSASASSSPIFVNTALRASGGNDSYLRIDPLPPIPSLESPKSFQKILLRLGSGKKLRERVVHKYFHGVDTKNIPQIVDCFHQDGAIIRDICSLTNVDESYEDLGRTVTPEFLGERCREFLAAHPDTRVMFRYSPTCGRGRNNNWVHVHWYEEGNWTGSSRGIEPKGSPLTVQGQTRFWVDDDLKITEIVITRTFSHWEEMLLKRG